MPHMPQLFLSNCVFTQLPPHKLKPTLQVQAPFWQPMALALPVHTLPQVPQLLRSESKLRHTPLQFEKPTWHWHLPAMQN